MKKFAIRSLFYILPLILVVVAILVIDPYYLIHKDKEFNQDVFDIGHSFDQGRRYKIFTYLNNPTDKIILGASEINVINERNIPEEGWHSLSFGGAPLQESLRLFIEITSQYQIKQAIIAPEFIKYYHSVSSGNGDPYYANFQWETCQSSEALDIYKNKLDYFVDKNTLKSSFEILKHQIGIGSLRSVPRVSKEEFWRQQQSYARNTYENAIVFQKKQKEVKELFLQIKNQIDSLGIKVSIVIPPQHTDLLRLEFSNRVYDIYKQYICLLVDVFGSVHYLAYVDGVSNDDKFFTDPFHCVTAVPILDELFGPGQRYLLTRREDVISNLNDIRRCLQIIENQTN